MHRAQAETERQPDETPATAPEAKPAADNSPVVAMRGSANAFNAAGAAPGGLVIVRW